MKLLPLLALCLVACGGSSSTSAEPSTPSTTTVAVPATSGSAPDASVLRAKGSACADGFIPAGENHECLKQCADVAQCAKGQKCLPTSWEMAPGQISHDSACL